MEERAAVQENHDLQPHLLVGEYFIIFIVYLKMTEWKNGFYENDIHLVAIVKLPTHYMLNLTREAAAALK